MFVKHTKETKAKAIAMRREGKPISTISKELHVAESALYHWFKAYEWVSDITCFKVKGKWIYVCVIIDLYSRKVVGYHISSKSSTRLLTTTFKNTYADRGKPQELTFHSDQGSQYTSKAFTSLLKECNAKQSLSAKRLQKRKTSHQRACKEKLNNPFLFSLFAHDF